MGASLGPRLVPHKPWGGESLVPGGGGGGGGGGVTVSHSSVEHTRHLWKSQLPSQAALVGTTKKPFPGKRDLQILFRIKSFLCDIWQTMISHATVECGHTTP